MIHTSMKLAWAAVRVPVESGEGCGGRCWTQQPTQAVLRSLMASSGRIDVSVRISIVRED